MGLRIKGIKIAIAEEFIQMVEDYCKKQDNKEVEKRIAAGPRSESAAMYYENSEM